MPQILLVEDNLGDAHLTEELLAGSPLRSDLHHVTDAESALDFLRRVGAYREAPRPDLILLDLNLPGMGGQTLLARLKDDEDLKTIPVVILTTSRSSEDVLQSHRLHANAYVVKPMSVDEFAGALRVLEQFWLSVALRPQPEG